MMNEFPQLQAAQQLGRTYRSLMAAFDQQLGMPLPRWRVLICLYQEDGCLSQKQLVRLLRIDPAAVTRQLKNIESLGLVERFTDEQDNRLTNVRVSPSHETPSPMPASQPMRCSSSPTCRRTS